MKVIYSEKGTTFKVGDDLGADTIKAKAGDAVSGSSTITEAFLTALGEVIVEDGLGNKFRVFWDIALEPIEAEQVADIIGDNLDGACKFCGIPLDTDQAHLHQGSWVGECCWDERLRSTE